MESLGAGGCSVCEASASRSRRRLAHRLIDPSGLLGNISGKDVLCLAGGGGQQSAAFALVGASVTVADLSPEQLASDRKAADHYGVSIQTVEADMRDLSFFNADSFDIVYHPYSINFVPECDAVFKQVSRHFITTRWYLSFAFANPFTMGTKQNSWNGLGYVLGEPYIAEAQLVYDDQDWVYNRTQTWSFKGLWSFDIV